jgi:hypothetical protein
MSSQIQLMIDVGRRSIEAVLAHGDLWFSQSWLAAAYETTTQNINIRNTSAV